MVRVIEDSVGAFIPGPRIEIAGAANGPLAGLDFAVKDLFDVAGAVTGYGHPDWARTHPPAAATAPVVLALLQAGASLRGKTKTMELAFGLTGENVWQGTPLNPAAPDRFPGGSSCGSVAAVAAGLVDFALGSDTGGSVRIPASYTGLFGIRPSWGVVSLAGACPLAPSYDTCGWFARTAGLLRQVGGVLLPRGGEGQLGPLLKVQEAWMNALPGTASALAAAMEAAERVLGPAMQIRLVPEGLAANAENFRLTQAEEAWASLGSWIEATRPVFGPGVGERFAAAKALDPAAAAVARTYRDAFRVRVRAVLAGGAVLIYPTSPVPAPRLDVGPEAQQAVRERTLGVTAIAGMAGLCEVTIPAGRTEGAPVGLSLVAAPGRDRALLALAEKVAAELRLPV